MNSHNEQAMYLVFLARDITQQKSTEQALEQGELQYRQLIITSAESTKAILNILTAKATAELQRQPTEEALLNCLASKIRTSLDLSEILATAVQQIRRLLKIDRCIFVWYRQDSDGEDWEIVHEAKSPDSMC
ncbi:MAG: GAF domain-containing protein [Richelia sp.]|nr:GAF domain-containing protein [Richelia sp.]CDN10776.1 Multi-sensor Signal Transduction Histidine Kinase [Richelia intracellularis]